MIFLSTHGFVCVNRHRCLDVCGCLDKGRREILIVHLLCSRSRGFPGGSVVKNEPADAGDTGDMGSIPGLEDPGRKWQPTLVFVPGESCG